MTSRSDGYETSAQREAQHQVALELERLWGCRLISTPKFYQFDYTITQDGIAKAFCEVKCRGASYPDYRLSLAKWKFGVEMSICSGLPFLLIVKNPDGIHWAQLTQRPLEIIVNGRTDRNDPNDIEPLVVIPKSLFKTMKLKGETHNASHQETV